MSTLDLQPGAFSMAVIDIASDTVIQTISLSATPSALAITPDGRTAYVGVTGAVQFSGSGPIRHVRLPGNTLQIRGQSVCASLRGVPFEPCFNLDKKDDRSFRGSVSGMGFAYCDFQHQGGSQMLMARAVARPRGRARSADASHATEVTARVETRMS